MRCVTTPREEAGTPDLDPAGQEALRADDDSDELRDLALTALGFGLMKFQRLQVRRRQLTEQLSEWFTAGPR